MTPPPFYIGLDAGASKTHLLAGASWREHALSLDGPPANVQRQGVEETARVLATLVYEALRQQPEAALRVVCAGVAGAGIPADQQALSEALRKRLGAAAAQVVIVHDAAIALEGAFEGGSGVIVTVGTGSIGFARTRSGGVLRTGGWGYLLGDEGGGHALGAAALRAVAHAFDGGPPTRLRTLLAERHGLATPEALVHRVYREGWPMQQAAPLVVEAAAAGDAEALRIVREQTHALAQQVQWLAHRSDDVAPRLALLGGLTQAAFYRDALTAALREALPGWLVQEPAHPPVVGALRLAVAADAA